MNIHPKVLVCCLLLIPLASCTKRKPANHEAALSAVTIHDLSSLKIAIAAEPTMINQGNDYDGGTLLHQALTNQPSFECADFLIAQGADPNKPDVTGEYPIHKICRFNGDTKCLKRLLDHGADPTVKWKDGSSPAQLARIWRFEDAASMLEVAANKP